MSMSNLEKETTAQQFGLCILWSARIVVIVDIYSVAIGNEPYFLSIPYLSQQVEEMMVIKIVSTFRNNNRIFASTN